MTETATMNGAEALLELFRAQGTDYIFCSPIAAWAPLWEALAKRKATRNVETPRYLNCRHEVLAVGLAAGYYKATGRAQAVLLPTGLGVLNGAMALRSAYHEHIPMVVVSPDTLVGVPLLVISSLVSLIPVGTALGVGVPAPVMVNRRDPIA